MEIENLLKFIYMRSKITRLEWVLDFPSPELSTDSSLVNTRLDFHNTPPLF